MDTQHGVRVPTTTDLEALHRAHRGRVDFVDVPELACLAVDGVGPPQHGDGSFQAAIQALFAVSYAAHFIVRKRDGHAPRVMPLEALWWVEGPHQRAFEDAEPEAWRWRAMVVQPPPIDEEVVARAVEQARAKVPDPAVRLLRWHEGRAAQTLHVGPYDAEGPTIAALDRAIRAAGLRPHGPHHEIYLGDPRRSAPDRLRTLLRHGVEPDAAGPGHG